jgi:hypothetical protein
MFSLSTLLSKFVEIFARKNQYPSFWMKNPHRQKSLQIVVILLYPCRKNAIFGILVKKFDHTGATLASRTGYPWF